MPTTITGPVRLPDGTIPAHGRIIFQRRAAGVTENITLPGPVEVTLDVNGAFTVELQGEAGGTRYAVKVEYQNGLTPRLIAVDLPDAVVTGTGSGTLAAVSAMPIPRGATDTVVIRQGESLNLALQYLDANDRPASLAGVAIDAWIARDSRIALTVAILDAGLGTFEITRVDTSALAGPYEFAVRMRAGGRTKIKTGVIRVDEVNG